MGNDLVRGRRFLVYVTTIHILGEDKPYVFCTHDKPEITYEKRNTGSHAHFETPRTNELVFEVSEISLDHYRIVEKPEEST